MQVLPATAIRYGVTDPGRSPEANLKAGTLYLSDRMQPFDCCTTAEGPLTSRARDPRLY
jgi:hypothetical protein